MNISDGISYQRLQQHLTSTSQTVSQLQIRIPQAQKVYSQNRTAYADHWSLGLDNKLLLVTSYSTPTAQFPHGQMNDLLSQAKKIESSDRDKAHALLDQLDSLLQTTSQIVNMILGPPGTTNQGFYDQLSYKQTHAIEALHSAQAEINAGTQVLREKEIDYWNSSHHLNFIGAKSMLARASNELRTAQYTASVRLEHSLIDMPLAYMQATNTLTMARDAVALANQEESDARSAQNAIDSTQAHINTVSPIVSMATYQRSLAQMHLLTANSSLQSARNAFYNGEYSQAKSLAQSAYSEADTARSMTVKPPPPSVSSSSSSSSSGGTSSWSSGSKTNTGSGPSKSSGGSWNGGSNKSSGGSWGGGSSKSSGGSWGGGSSKSSSGSWHK